MSNILAQIAEINKSIESLNAKKTKIDAQREVLEGQIKKGIQKYKDEYGVDLGEGGYKKLASNIKAEYSKVQDSVTKELELATQVVNCIESGDIAGANKLLGVDPEEVESLELGEDDEEAVKVSGVEDVIGSLSGFEDVEKEASSSGFSLNFGGLTLEEDVDDLGSGLDDLLNGGQLGI